MNLKQELYRITDSFLTEAKNQNGEDRSLERLNADRHLAVEEFTKLFAQFLKELMEEDKKYDNLDSRVSNNIRTMTKNDGYNQRNHEINSKINKILNK